MTGEAHSFFETLFGSAPEEHFGMLWTLQDRRSHWQAVSRGSDALADTAVRLGERFDVYVAVSTATTSAGPTRRISSENSAGIFGLWADVDIADPDIHKKWNLPPSEADARTLLDASGVKPSLLVHSGHGLQAWWLFAEFWEFDGEQDRLEAGSLAQRWNTTLRVRGAERGWTVDSTFDLARVMRVPGTTNRKGEPVPVRLLDDCGIRYGKDDFDPFCADERGLAQLGLSPTRSYVLTPGLILKADAVPPFRKFQALLTNDSQFKKTWDRKRTEFRDQSGNVYNLSLASQAAAAQWTDQEIADLIIYDRAEHDDDPGKPNKGLRMDYIARTISRARDVHGLTAAAEDLEENLDALREARRQGDDEEVKVKRRASLEDVGQQLGLQIVSFIKYTSDPPSYVMVTTVVSIPLGDAGGIISWSAMKQSIVEGTKEGHQIGRFKQAQWDRITAAIFECCELQDVGMEATESGQLEAWLTEYLAAKPPVDDRDAADISGRSFVDENGVHIFGGAFRDWLWLYKRERVNNKDLGRMLRSFGCSPFKLNVVSDEGRRSSRAAWTLPEGMGQ